MEDALAANGIAQNHNVGVMHLQPASDFNVTAQALLPQHRAIA